MKITQQQLKKIINEELSVLLRENEGELSQERDKLYDERTRITRNMVMHDNEVMQKYQSHSATFYKDKGATEDSQTHKGYLEQMELLNDSWGDYNTDMQNLTDKIQSLTNEINSRKERQIDHLYGRNN